MRLWLGHSKLGRNRQVANLNLKLAW
jgi:hypothetical protein